MIKAAIILPILGPSGVFSKLQIRLQSAGLFHNGYWVFMGGVMYFVDLVADVVLNVFIQFKTIIGGIEVNVIVFQRPPEPFDPDIVQRSSLAVHRDLYSLLFQVLGPDGTGVLAALVRVQDFRFTMCSNRILECKLPLKP